MTVSLGVAGVDVTIRCHDSGDTNHRHPENFPRNQCLPCWRI